MNPLFSLLAAAAAPQVVSGGKGPRLGAPPPAPRPLSDSAFDARNPAPRAVPATPPQNPLMALFNGGGWGGDPRRLLRAVGASMAGARETNDPFLAFGHGFGGATGYYDGRDASAAEAALEREQTTYDRSKDSADFALRKAAEDRLSKSAELANKKTAAEIERLAKQNGLTVSQMLEIERIAQAAGENMYGAERQRVIEAERKRLMEQYASGNEPEQKAGLSKRDKGLTPDVEVTATGPDGQRAVFRNGQWIDAESGEPL